jgi:hypothetical protein
MTTSLDDYSDDDPLDERGLLKDGHRLRVPMTARDSLSPVQRAIAEDRGAHAPLRAVDALGRDGLALCRPGSRHLTAGSATTDDAELALQRQLVADAYMQATFEAENAWKRGPGGLQDASALGTEYSGREGDACTVRAGAAEGYLEGCPGHLARVDGKLVCVPDNRRTDSVNASDAEAIKQRAYDEMCRAGEQAWKNLGRS